MISNVKKNKINLFELKSKKDLKNVENIFDKFLKKNIFKKKYFSKARKCACGSKKYINNLKRELFKYVKCKCNT